jgi:WD40 repeat protein
MFMLPSQGHSIHHLAFSPSGLTLAAARLKASTSSIAIWDLVEREPVTDLDPAICVGGLIFIRDDATLVVKPLFGAEPQLLNVQTMEAESLFESTDGAGPFPPEVVADAERLVAAFSFCDESDSLIDVRAVDLDTRHSYRLAQFALSPTSAVAVLPGNPLLLAVAQEAPPRIILLTPGGLPDTIPFRPRLKFTGIRFSPDRRTLALASAHRIRLWDSNDRRMTADIVKPPRCGAWEFTPDGRTLGVVSHDGTVRFYDVGSGRQRAAFELRIGPIYALAFAPDGMRAAAAGGKGTIVVWDVDCS